MMVASFVRSDANGRTDEAPSINREINTRGKSDKHWSSPKHDIPTIKNGRYSTGPARHGAARHGSATGVAREIHGPAELGGRTRSAANHDIVIFRHRQYARMIVRQTYGSSSDTVRALYSPLALAHPPALAPSPRAFALSLSFSLTLPPPHSLSLSLSLSLYLSIYLSIYLYISLPLYLSPSLSPRPPPSPYVPCG